MKNTSLADDVLAAFKRACLEQNYAIAEHILQALEVIARRSDCPEPLNDAYLELARSLPKNH
jgi:hypothetical protein